MISAKIDGKQATKMLRNLVEYTDGFITETSAQQGTITAKISKLSVDGFYEYLDQLARVNPGMLHHVYEWGRVGDPSARLYELKRNLTNTSATITTNFLQSQTETPTSDHIFYDKATVMEDGLTVIVNEIEAEALFFEVDGIEYFRTGPIVIENPGGPDVRGSFVEQFEEFYNTYFDRVYLNAIRFYQYFMDAKPYEQNFVGAMKSGNARSVGKKTALSWIMNMPVGDFNE